MDFEHSSPRIQGHESEDAGAPAISPTTLSAGVHVLVEEWGICGSDVAPDLARDVFRAMWVQRDRESN